MADRRRSFPSFVVPGVQRQVTGMEQSYSAAIGIRQVGQSRRWTNGLYRAAMFRVPAVQPKVTLIVGYSLSNTNLKLCHPLRLSCSTGKQPHP